MRVNSRKTQLDILPRLKRVGFLCASAGSRIRHGLTPAPQFGDAPPKYIFSRIEVAVVYLAALGTYPFAVAKFQITVNIYTHASILGRIESVYLVNCHAILPCNAFKFADKLRMSQIRHLTSPHSRHTEQR